MLKQSLQKAAHKVAPRSVLERYHHLKLNNQARRLKALTRETGDMSVWIDHLFRSHFFRLLQKKTEILRLLEIVKAQAPLALCEIGAAGGGTTFLFAQIARPDATVVTIDLALSPARKSALTRFARARQKIIGLQGDSQSPDTLHSVVDCLEGRGLDVLYIDGDHDYEGVSADFKLYGPLVRSGGLIAFHDIVPDFRTRYGIETASYTGDVPKFWNEIKTSYECEEIIEDPAQDGMGIGILHWQK